MFYSIKFVFRLVSTTHISLRPSWFALVIERPE